MKVCIFFAVQNSFYKLLMVPSGLSKEKFKVDVKRLDIVDGVKF